MKPIGRVRGVAGLALGLAMTVPGFAYDACTVPPDLDLTDIDTSRLANLDTSRTRGLGAALRAENPSDRAVVAGLFDPGLAPVDPELLPGDYRCRTIKLGYDPAIVVYQWFRCRIAKGEGDGFTVSKLTGSQNFSGELVPAGGAGYAYRGALTYGYETTPVQYGADPERDQVGCLSAVTSGNRHFVLELPFPAFESFHDVIEFQPAG